MGDIDVGSWRHCVGTNYSHYFPEGQSVALCGVKSRRDVRNGYMTNLGECGDCTRKIRPYAALGYIYMIRAENTDYYKIGITGGDPVDRMRQIQGGNPFKLILMTFCQVEGYIKAEQMFHRMLARYKAPGGSEWFEIPQNLASIIERFIYFPRIMERLLQVDPIEIVNQTDWHIECEDCFSSYIVNTRTDEETNTYLCMTCGLEFTHMWYFGFKGIYDD